jgi:hypothetical protein
VFAKSTELRRLSEVTPLIFYVKNVPITLLFTYFIIFFIDPCGNQARGELFLLFSCSYSFLPMRLAVQPVLVPFFFFFPFSVLGASIVMRLLDMICTFFFNF